MKNINMSVVIAVHNRKIITLNCLRQLERQTFKDFSVVVVDDGSTDGTAEAIYLQYPSTKVIRGTGSWWWTKSVNAGIRYAIDNNASHILLLNDDTFFDDNYMALMAGEIRNNPAALIGSLNLTQEQPNRIYFSGAKSLNPFFFRYRRYHKTFSVYKEDDSCKSYPSVYLPARGALVPAAVFNRIGLLDEEHFPQYASDVEFTLNAHRAGFDMYVAQNVRLYTPVNSTGSGDIYKKEPFLKFLSSFRNKYAKRDLGTNLTLIKNHVPAVLVPFAFLSYNGTILLKYFIHKIRNTQ